MLHLSLDQCPATDNQHQTVSDSLPAIPQLNSKRDLHPPPGKGPSCSQPPLPGFSAQTALWGPPKEVALLFWCYSPCNLSSLLSCSNSPSWQLPTATPCGPQITLLPKYPIFSSVCDVLANLLLTHAVSGRSAIPRSIRKGPVLLSLIPV